MLSIAAVKNGSALRLFRMLWPLLFVVPLSWWANRGCAIAGVDPAYHTTLWIHERLGTFITLLVAASIVTVCMKIAVARRRLSKLFEIAEPVPERAERAFATAAVELGTRVPRIAYLNVRDPIASTVAGPVILLSRGFADRLNDDELFLVARHELVHVRRNDANAGTLWHLAFAAFLVPGFEPLERRLHAARERRANTEAARGREDRYIALVDRAVDGSLCSGAMLRPGAAAARYADRLPVWLAPASIALLLIALPLSHTEFMRALPYLESHHC